MSHYYLFQRIVLGIVLTVFFILSYHLLVLIMKSI